MDFLSEWSAITSKNSEIRLENRIRMRIRYGLIAFDVQKSIDFEASMRDVKSVLEIALGELFRGQF